MQPEQGIEWGRVRGSARVALRPVRRGFDSHPLHKSVALLPKNIVRQAPTPDRSIGVALKTDVWVPVLLHPMFGATNTNAMARPSVCDSCIFRTSFRLKGGRKVYARKGHVFRICINKCK